MHESTLQLQAGLYNLQVRLAGGMTDARRVTHPPLWFHAGRVRSAGEASLSAKGNQAHVVKADTHAASLHLFCTESTVELYLQNLQKR